MVEGIKMVREALELNLCVSHLLVTPDCYEKTKDFLGDREVNLVEDSVFNSISNEVTPQGILALVKKPNAMIEKATNCCLFLDGVSDPANVGAIIRTAVASNYTEIYAYSSADPYSPKAVRASMSGIFKVKVFTGEREELLDKIDMPIVVADMGGEDAFSADIPLPFCLVIGNEGRGVSDTLREKANYTVKIPMQNGMESLNASVSAGILMYALKKDK